MTETVRLDPAKGHPRIGVTFGHNRIGGYRLFLWDPSGSNASMIGEGHNGDLKPDEFPIGKTAEELNGHTIGAEAAIKSVQHAVESGEDSDGPYSVTFRITQDGNDVQGSPVTYRGKLQNGRAAVVEFIELQT